MVAPDALARLALFGDLAAPELAAVAQLMDEASYTRESRVLREGISTNAFYVILDGEAAVLIDGSERARLHAGDFFGEISILTAEPTGADVVAVSEELRCATLPGAELRPLLLEHPHIAVRMLDAGARRLRAANLWAG
ncbi:MAG: cyclic nucleotide-binding domain-containing protein [Gaiellales bacterium]